MEASSLGSSTTPKRSRNPPPSPYLLSPKSRFLTPMQVALTPSQRLKFQGRLLSSAPARESLPGEPANSVQTPLSRSTDRSWATGVLEALSNHHSHRLGMDTDVLHGYRATTPTTLSRLSLSAAATHSPESTQLLDDDHELEMVRGDMVNIGSALELSQARLLKELSKAQEEIDRKSPPLLGQELDYSVVASPLLNPRNVDSRLEQGTTRRDTHEQDIYSSPLKGGDDSHHHSTGVVRRLGYVDSSQNFGTPNGKGQASSAPVRTNPSVMEDEENIQYDRSHRDGDNIAAIGNFRSSSRIGIGTEAVNNSKGGIEGAAVDNDEDQASSSSELQQSLLQAAYLELNAARAELAASESRNEELKKKSVAQAQEAHSMLQSLEAATLELNSTHEMLESSKMRLQEMHGRAENAEDRLLKCEAIGRLLGSAVLRTTKVLSSALYRWSRSTVAMRFSIKERELQEAFAVLKRQCEIDRQRTTDRASNLMESYSQLTLRQYSRNINAQMVHSMFTSWQHITKQQRGALLLVVQYIRHWQLRNLLRGFSSLKTARDDRNLKGVTACYMLWNSLRSWRTRNLARGWISFLVQKETGHLNVVSLAMSSKLFQRRTMSCALCLWLKWRYNRTSSRQALERTFAFHSISSKRRGMIQWRLDTENKRFVMEALHRLSVHMQSSIKATLVSSISRWRGMVWWRRHVYGTLRCALSVNRRLILRTRWDCLKKAVKSQTQVETHFQYFGYTVFLSWKNAHRVKQLARMHLKGVILASELRNLRCFNATYMSWTRWSQLAALHSRREDEELLEREQLLSAMLLRQRSQRLMFQRWRNVLVQLREAKSAAINRLCCTQNALMKNAFGAIRLLPLERPTYHLISLLMQHWRQQRLCTYWRTWKVTLTLKKNDLDNQMNVVLRMCDIFNLAISRGGELRLSFMLWRTNAALLSSSSSFSGCKGESDTKNGEGLVKKKQEDMICLSCVSYHESYKKAKRKICQLRNALRDVDSMSESTSRFILSASSSIFESNGRTSASNNK